MDKRIKNEFAILMLAEILFEKNLINKPTFEEIKRKVKNEKSHISQNT